ncbi:MAG TPA: sel1 repeat family protein, partial [Erythrobacter sp.]|nr:sel1 repeat family protein [Erythrobacter sp.]
EQRSVCEFAASLRQRRQEIEQALAERHEAQRRRLAERERASQVVQSFLGQGKYDSAIYAAIYHSRQLADARTALEATLQAGALGSVYKDHLYVLDYWFPSGRLNAAVNAEIERRSRGDDCGIYNCTNMPGASSRRWAAGAGRTAASRSSSSSASSFQPARMKSAAEISRETRNRYRTAHCTMNNNANRYLCN